MTYKKLRIPKVLAINVMNELGKIEDGLEFVDLIKSDPEAKKNLYYANYIQRCDDLEKKIEYFELLCGNYNLKQFKHNTLEEFLKSLENDMKKKRGEKGEYFDVVEAEVIENERRMSELIKFETDSKDTIDNLTEMIEVIQKCNELVETSGMAGIGLGFHQSASRNALEEARTTGVEFLAGTILATHEMRMKRMIFRASRGRAFTQFFNLNITDIKTVFIYYLY
jgi:hypothetical protein